MTMRTSGLRVFAFTGIKFLLCLVFIVCLAPPAWAKASTVVPVPPMAWLLRQLAGDDLEIITLIPPGASPHSYDVTPRQMAQLAEADIFFTLNMPMERQLLARLQTSRPDIEVVDLNQGIAMRYFSEAEQGVEDHEHGHEQHSQEHDLAEPDPHTWLDPHNAQIQAANMARSLRPKVNNLPEKLAILQEKLGRLDSRIKAALAPFQEHSFLVYHPSFGYLAQRYGLKQVAVEMEGKEPTPRRLAGLVEQAKAHGVKVIFVQPQFPRAAVERLAGEIQGAVVSLDPLAYDYINNLDTMVKNLQQGL